MSDSIKKWEELVEEGVISPNKSTQYYKSYDELQLTIKVTELARKYKDVSPLTLYKIAVDELSK